MTKVRRRVRVEEDAPTFSLDQPLPRRFSRMSLPEAREWLRARLMQGGEPICPACSRSIRIYRWTLYSTAVRALFWFYEFGGVEDYVPVRRIEEAGHKGKGDQARLRHWGLLECDESRRDDGGRAGRWRVTDLGERFIYGEVSLPRYAYICNKQLLFLDGPGRSVQQCLGVRFDYGDLMERVAV